MNLVELVIQAMPQGLTLEQLEHTVSREQLDAELAQLLAIGELIQVGPYYRCLIGAGVHAPARPDARRQLYRELIIEGVRALVLLDKPQALALIEELLDAHPEQDVVRAMIFEANAQLHEGNFARYKLTPQEFEFWCKSSTE